MKLQRVQVPDFRVLKNVDISFEKDFLPNIFPLGSQNGGGKSTLLQLIFVLLHCSGDRVNKARIGIINMGLQPEELQQHCQQILKQRRILNKIVILLL